MNKKRFSASDWFKTSEYAQKFTNETSMGRNPIAGSLAPFSPEAQNLHRATHGISNYFVPGWRGESLISKDVKKFKAVLEKLHQDAKTQFYTKEAFSRKLKIATYDEFLSYAEFKAINCTHLDHYTSFWKEIKNENSLYSEHLENFIDILSFRIAVVYLLKIRFIVILHEQTQAKFDAKHIFYPNSCLTKLFRTASSTQLHTKAFEQNIFSWYKPNESLKNELTSFTQICCHLNITEIIKTYSLESEKILHSSTDYSHSISHKSFGLFLNSLLINFPLWLESINSIRTNKYKTFNNHLEIISTKFAGDNLESLGLSHWLAQESNKDIKWEQILCPDFKKNDFLSGLFLKTSNELQFLTFLAQIAHSQGFEARPFISNVINSHLYNRKNTFNSQPSFNINNDESLSFSTYDRVVLNLTHFPKNNPQHFLFSQINQQKQYLKDNGYLYIMTSKKLFVPSQKNKIENLLKNFKVEGIFNLEAVKGKGEVGNYIYILSKRALHDHPTKHSCLNFRYTADLETFHEFSQIIQLSEKFFRNHLQDLPSLSQVSNDHFRLEFYQDAIVNGQLIHSTSKDSSKVTHPLFFKKLMGLCNSLDYFFDIQSIDFNENNYNKEENSLFHFSHSFQREKSPYTIIVDQRNRESTQIEFISTSALEAKAYDYGHALCSYFYAYPKWPNLNIFAIKDFFESSIGQQIVNLTFSNEIRKIKGNLNKLLIPKYFSRQNQIPEHILMGLKLFSLGPNEILSLHPSELQSSYKKIKGILPQLVISYPSETIGLISNFKRSLIGAMEVTGSRTKRSNGINFNNPVLKSPLLLSKTYPIYPDNDDIYLEFNSHALESVHSPLTRVRATTEKKDDYTSHILELYSGETKVITLYTDQAMISFLDFILNNVLNAPISKILQSVEVPALDDLKSILNAYGSLNRSLEELSKELPALFDQLINSTIFSH